MPIACSRRDIVFLLCFLTKNRGPPQVHLENHVSNFDLKLSTDKGLNERSLFWKFHIFLLSVSKDMNIQLLCYKWCKKTIFSLIFLSRYRSNQKLRNFQNKLLSLRPLSVESFKSKFESWFSRWTWGGGHDFLLKSSVKIRHLDKNKLCARTLFRVFIAR